MRTVLKSRADVLVALVKLSDEAFEAIMLDLQRPRSSETRRELAGLVDAARNYLRVARAEVDQGVPIEPA